MLPELSNKRNQQRNSSVQNTQMLLTKDNKNTEMSKNAGKSYSAKKVRTGGGFIKSAVENKYSRENVNEIIQQRYVAKYAKIPEYKDLGSEIKLIEKKIKACQRKIEQEKKQQKRKAEQATKDPDQPDYDFDRVVQRQLELQGYGSAYENQDNKNFDFLTNPGGKPVQQQEEPQIIPEPRPLIREQKVYDLQAGLEKLQRHHEQALKKKFQRRQMFPHQACRRKTPKLAITHKNLMQKYGKAGSQTEHMFRVLTKQITPQEIYPTIPNFAVVKDSLSKNIVAYLGDYKPFLQKTKEAGANGDNKSQQLIEEMKKSKKEANNMDIVNGQ